MEELAVGLAASIYAIESKTNLLVGNSEPFTIGGFGDEAVGGVGTVAGYMFEGAADPAFGACGGGTGVSITASV